jgi:DNA methylase
MPLAVQNGSCSGFQKPDWIASCVHDECSLHQLSPYIGKLKSSIATFLVQRYSKPGDLVIDPFSGAGTIPLEAIRLERRIFAVDHSAYAAVLNVGKLPLSKQTRPASEGFSNGRPDERL